MATSKRGYADFQEHLARLDDAGLVRRIDAEINRDTELHPLVRGQYRGRNQPFFSVLRGSETLCF
ncbi:MAG: hypothetical protein QF393_13725 [Rhodospirillales bacterium]|jgi:4-hydroxy-3-polyprenylbenzoate decarboxylase|nr:hypothetical protein [Rhodospirillaceae bacterium]MDP6429070.1 hypothetical protein [Rhodospirillales bacterium]MDP6644272.1 hypothetical protein [Rhodospirillales bacterium]|tara:strand:- start:4757 stop:4951 length:195 start_codon:yes stop_codon:yes gene_type:complete